MKQKKKLYAVIFFSMIIVTGIALSSIHFISLKITKTKYEEIKSIVENAIVVFTESDITISKGEIKRSSSYPFIQDGLTFVSVNDVAQYIGASFAIETDGKVISLSHKGNNAQFMLDFNVVILNDEAIIMRSKPIEKDDQIYLPIDVLAKVLNVPFFRDYNQQVMVIGASKPLTDDNFYTLKKYAGLKITKNKSVKELDELNQKACLDDINQLAFDNILFVTDDDSNIYKWYLLDDFSLVKEVQVVNYDFPPNTVFVIGDGKEKDTLFIAETGEKFSLTPDLLVKNDLKYATMKFIEEKLIRDMLKIEDNTHSELIEMYKAVVSGDIMNNQFKEEKNKKYLFSYGDSSKEILDIKQRMVISDDNYLMPLTENYDYFLFENIIKIQKQNDLPTTGYIDKQTYDFINLLENNSSDIPNNIDEQKWIDFCSKAKSGDVLLFRNKLSNEKYGYFNHAALILDVSPEKGEIHVLQARSIDLGVGADLPIDIIRYEKFFSDSYWKKSDIALLCSVKGVNDEKGKEIAEKGYEKFKDYKFGFGGFQGTKETTCVELIRNSLKLGNVEIISNKDYLMKMKSALEGETTSLILLPDDILMSDNVVIKDYWEKP